MCNFSYYLMAYYAKLNLTEQQFYTKTTLLPDPYQLTKG